MFGSISLSKLLYDHYKTILEIVYAYRIKTSGFFPTPTFIALSISYLYMQHPFSIWNQYSLTNPLKQQVQPQRPQEPATLSTSQAQNRSISIASKLTSFLSLFCGKGPRWIKSMVCGILPTGPVVMPASESDRRVHNTRAWWGYLTLHTFHLSIHRRTFIH